MSSETLIAPQSIEAEQALLGGILLDPDSLLIALEIIDPEDFYSGKNRIIFSAFIDLYELGESIDFITLSDRLKVKKKLEAIGGLGYISQLLSYPTGANIKYHANIIKQKAILRRVKSWAANISREANEGIEDLRAWFSKAVESFIKIKGSRGESNPYPSDIISAIRENWRKMKEGRIPYAPTDWKFQTLIPGYFPKHFWMIGGYTSNGKSSLLTQILADTCREGFRPLIFSLEDSREEKFLKLIANVADVRQKKLILGAVEGIESEIQEAEDLIKRWNPIFYDDVYALDEIRLKSIQHKIQDNINLIAIDYVQNIHAGQGDLYKDMRAVSMMLDKLKKDLSLTVIALSQVSNEAMKSGSELIMLKGAGELASTADIVIWLKRVKGEGRERFLNCEVRKNRPFGATGIVPLIFSETWSRIDRRGF